MKKIILILLLMIANLISAQNTIGESVDWSGLKSFSTQSFIFKTKQIDYKCSNCRYMEIKSVSGISGYLVLGDATYAIDEKNLTGKSSSIMIRLNPQDLKDFIKTSESIELTDLGFNSLSLIILNGIFKLCYHSGMNALIPKSGDYTVYLFTEKEGDLLVSYSEGKLESHELTRKK